MLLLVALSPPGIFLMDLMDFREMVYDHIHDLEVVGIVLKTTRAVVRNSGSSAGDSVAFTCSLLNFFMTFSENDFVVFYRGDNFRYRSQCPEW